MVRPAGSHALEQQIQIERRALSQILDVRRQEGLGRPATLVSQHAQKIPLGVELRGVAQIGHLLARDPVDPHVGPSRALAVARFGDLTQERDHA
jgi:hypothetical protein